MAKGVIHKQDVKTEVVVEEQKTLFLSAPYSSVSPGVREDITRAAEGVAMLFWENGVAVICPHLNTGHFSDHDGKEKSSYRKGYVELAQRCDALLVLFPSIVAQGVQDEIEAVEGSDKPIFKDVKKALLWAKKGVM